jgi:hypothetical protein
MNETTRILRLADYQKPNGQPKRGLAGADAERAYYLGKRPIPRKPPHSAR